MADFCHAAIAQGGVAQSGRLRDGCSFVNVYILSAPEERVAFKCCHKTVDCGVAVEG